MRHVPLFAKGRRLKRAFHHTAAPLGAPQNPAAATQQQALRRLHDEAGAGDLPAVKAMVAAGADPAAALEGPMASLCTTALHAAAGRGQMAVLAWLLDEAGLAADLCPAEIKTRHRALMSAALSGQAEAAALLMSHGADVNARDYKSETALHMAADKGHAAVVKILLDAGADVSLRDRFGLRAQDVCCNNPADALSARARTQRHGDILDLFHQAQQARAALQTADLSVLAADVTIFPLRLKTEKGKAGPNDNGGKSRPGNNGAKSRRRAA
ncbi:MAG: ankyrin repeat domain-containing protein [Alphaproteobacteria bacterium]|nr:ankyrin repeat domain-containing protein [Alphaproteobacteria bacterium]